MSKPVIFISAVSKELHSARDLIAKTLIALGYEPKWQDIAPTETGMLPKVLRDWIDQSDAVIQLVGHHYGFAPKEPDAEFGLCSYTQLEALYARQQGKKVWYFILTPEHPTDPCADEASEQRELQDAYRTKVTTTAHLYHRSSSLEKTELLVHRIKNELAELRQEEQARQRQLQQSIDTTHQKVTDLGVEVLTRFDDLKQQARRHPKIAITPESWPQPAPFHNRGFPDQRNFVGRAALLRSMKKFLDAGRDVALTQPMAMHGAGGVGKTRAAVEFARVYGNTYTLRLLLDAQNPEALRTSLAEVARKLRLNEADSQASEEALVLLTLRLLRTVPTALVIADNADTPAALEAVRALCREPGGVRWLITTRLTDLGSEFAPQRVDLLTEAEAVKLLQKRAQKNGGHQPGPDADARDIARELGCLPLALQQAAAYVGHQRFTWAAYRTLLAANPSKALSRDAEEMKKLPESILRTYALSLQQLTPIARELLEIASHLAPAPIPDAVFLNQDRDGILRTALVELADLSLLEWQGGLLEIHRAIAIAVLCELSQDDDRVQLEQACRLVKNYAPKGAQHPKHWPAWAALRPHVEHLLASVVPSGAAKEVYLWLLANWPVYLSALGEHAAAISFYHNAIDCSQCILGTDHPATLSNRMNLANALDAHGRYVEAENEHRAILQIKERTLGAKHQATLASRNNLAVTLYSQGKNAEAEQEHRVVLLLRKQELGEEHPETLSSQMNLALVLDAQGKHAEAEQVHHKVLQLLLRIQGAEHPDTLTTRHNLAVSMYVQGKHAEAEQEMRAVLQARVGVLGAEHPETLATRANLAAVTRAQGKDDLAEQECRAILQQQKRSLGIEHPETLMSQMNLAIALASSSKFAEAEQEMRIVLQIREGVLGLEHPDVALSCYNLALCLEYQKKLLESLPLMQRAEKVWARSLGPAHHDTKHAAAVVERLEAAMKPPSQSSTPV